MKELKDILKQINFRWLPKHINHIAEHIVFDKRNISFLAINALFRSTDYKNVIVITSYSENDEN